MPLEEVADLISRRRLPQPIFEMATRLCGGLRCAGQARAGDASYDASHSDSGFAAHIISMRFHDAACQCQYFR